MFTLGLKGVEHNYYIKKCFKRKLHRIKFSTKKSVDAYLYLPPEWSEGLQRSPFFKCYTVLKRESRFTFDWMLPKICIISNTASYIKVVQH